MGVLKVWNPITSQYEPVIGSQGPEGPVGPEGPEGPPGADGGSYTHTQLSADTTWNVAHGLGRYPAVTVLDSAGSQVECSVTHTDLNNVVVTLSYAVSGTATCS